MLGSIFKRKKTATSAAPPPPADHRADYPEALALAMRHSAERDQSHAWLLNGDDPPELEELEAPDAMFDRQRKELATATEGMSDIGRVRFQGVYHAVSCEQTEAGTARIIKAQGIDPDQAADLRALAENLVADHVAGKPIPGELEDAFMRGTRDGRRMAEAEESDRRRVIAEISEEDIEWRRSDASLSGPLSLPSYVYEAAKQQGMRAVFGERTQAQRGSQSTNPTRLPFLKHAPFGAMRLETVTFVAGRLGKGKGHLLASGEVLAPGGEFSFPINSVRGVELATQERVSKWSSGLGWGLVGGATFGIPGAVVGGVLGGQKEQVTYLLTFEDDHKCLVSSSAELYHRFLGSTI